MGNVRFSSFSDILLRCDGAHMVTLSGRELDIEMVRVGQEWCRYVMCYQDEFSTHTYPSTVEIIFL